MERDTKKDVKVLTPKFSFSSDFEPLRETRREGDLMAALEGYLEGG